MGQILFVDINQNILKYIEPEANVNITCLRLIQTLKRCIEIENTLLNNFFCFGKCIFYKKIIPTDTGLNIVKTGLNIVNHARYENSNM